MQVQIDPVPTPEEREALLLALSDAERRPPAPPAWWAAGIRDAVGGEPQEGVDAG